MAKGLEAQLFLARGAHIMLTANLWTAAGLVNDSMGTVQDIIYNDQGPPYLPTVVFIGFDKYKGPTITALDGTKVVLITSIQKVKMEECVHDYNSQFVLPGSSQCTKVRDSLYQELK